MTFFRLMAALAIAVMLAAPAPTRAADIGGRFALVDHHGNRVTQESYSGKYLLIFFGYTYCPDVCPTELLVFGQTLDALGDKAKQIQALFITVNPERDTPEALSAYFGFDDRIVALTGSVDAAARARAAYKLVAQKAPLPDSALGYTVNHGRFFYINDRAGQPQHAIVGGVSPQELAALLRREMAK